MHQEGKNKQCIIICFDWTVRMLNHRGFCARLVRKICVPDTFIKVKNYNNFAITIS